MRSRRNRNDTVVRWGVIGLGLIGEQHAQRLQRIRGARLEAVCARSPSKAKIAARLGCRFFQDYRQLLAAGCDAVLIATPHPSHVSIARDALRAGCHVLIEKPVAVEMWDAHALRAEADRHPDRKVGVMFQMRTDERFLRLREWVQSGRLGRLQRITWIVTDWFRPNAYFASASWRGTWQGEGGGLLVNQCPHQLDLLLCLAGMPARVTARGGFGRWHPIEVEDDVVAILEYPSGLTCTFIASTGEAPGMCRLEVAGTGGLAVWEGRKLSVTFNRVPSDRYSSETRELFGRPSTYSRTWSGADDRIGSHEAVLHNFTEAVRHGRPLVATLEDGIREVELASAILWALGSGKTIRLPLDASAAHRWYARWTSGDYRKRQPGRATSESHTATEPRG